MNKFENSEQRPKDPYEKMEIFSRAFQRYLDHLSSVDIAEAYLPYGWFESPESIPFECAVFYEMGSDFGREIANEANMLVNLARRLLAWKETFKEFEDHKLILTHEFINPVGFTVISLPYAIKQRFVFGVSHVSHQANRFVQNNWKDNLPSDPKIKEKVMTRVAANWRSFGEFLKAWSVINEGEDTAKLSETRKKLHHRLPPRFVVGHTQLFRRIVDDNDAISYGFGGELPLQPGELASLGLSEFRKIKVAFELFQRLVLEQAETVNNYITHRSGGNS